MADKTQDFGPFQPAQNQQAYMKVGVYGFGGSGKTTTACLLSKGIVESSKTKKPVCFIDTETGSDHFVGRFKEWGVPFMQTKSKVFLTLMEGVAWAEKNASVLIVDSITHIWKEMQDSYKKAKTANLLRRKGIPEDQIEAGFASGKYEPAARLTFADWGPLKDQWGRFTTAFLNSKVHIIICGRAGWEYDFFEDEDGTKQIEKTGSKMKAEADLSYEPSLLLEMRREAKDAPDGRLDARFWDHVCYVLKDRSDLIDGKRFVNPTFNDFLPVWNQMNIGGDHVGVVTEKDSSGLFAKDSPDNITDNRKKREILIEEIQGELVSAFPGQSSEDKKIKTDLVFEAFGTRSWVQLADFDVPALKTGLEKIRALIKARTENIPATAEKEKGGKK